MAAFLGMRGTGDFAANEVPESWAEFIMKEFPNGSAPLFAMQGMFSKETVDSYKYHWWTETLPTQAGAVTNIYIDAGLGTAYVYASHQATAGIQGATLYVKVALALAKEFRDGHLVLLRDTDQLDVDVRGRVVDVALNGASSYIAVELTEADDNHSDSSTYNLATVDRILIIGSAFPEGSPAPLPLTYLPVEYENLTQIQRNTFEITGTAKATKLRTGNGYLADKMRCAELHSIEWEKTIFFGKQLSTTGRNNKPLRYTDGIIPWLITNNPTNVADYQTETDAAYAGKTWRQAGAKWLNTKLSLLFRYLNQDAIAFCGDAALLGIQELAEDGGHINLTVKQMDFGIKVVEWHTPFGSLFLKTHPLFSHETTNQNIMVILHPSNVKLSPLVGEGENRDTKFEENMQVPGVDGKLDGFITEAGTKFMFPNQFMYLKGVGKDNSN